MQRFSSLAWGALWLWVRYPHRPFKNLFLLQWLAGMRAFGRPSREHLVKVMNVRVYEHVCAVFLLHPPLHLLLDPCCWLGAAVGRLAVLILCLPPWGYGGNFLPLWRFLPPWRCGVIHCGGAALCTGGAGCSSCPALCVGGAGTALCTGGSIGSSIDSISLSSAKSMSIAEAIAGLSIVGVCKCIPGGARTTGCPCGVSIRRLDGLGSHKQKS